MLTFNISVLKSILKENNFNYGVYSVMDITEKREIAVIRYKESECISLTGKSAATVILGLILQNYEIVPKTSEKFYYFKFNGNGSIHLVEADINKTDTYLPYSASTLKEMNNYFPTDEYDVDMLTKDFSTHLSVNMWNLMGTFHPCKKVEKK